MKKQLVWRGGLYLSGMMTIAMGITLSTKSGLGISPSTSPSMPLPTGWARRFRPPCLRSIW